MKRLLLVAATVAALAVTASSTAARPSGLHIFDCLENGGRGDGAAPARR